MKTLIRLFLTVFLPLWVGVSTVLYAVPIFLVAPFSPRVSRLFARAWSVNLLLFGGVRVRVEGLERLDRHRRYVFVGNHASYFDIPALLTGIPFMLSFIAKKELFQIPVFGQGLYVLGHVWIDRANARKARESISRAVARLKKEQVSLVIFPEGTRSIDGSVGEFKRGSFTLAIEAGVPLVPVAIAGAREVLPKGAAGVKPGTIRLILGDPIPTEGLTVQDKTALMEKTRGAIVRLVGEGNPGDRGPAIQDT